MEEGPRVIALAIIEHDGKILVGERHDDVKNEVFYRPLGGHIDFREFGAAAVIRELQEELYAEATNARYLGVIENLFTYNNEPGHEVDLIYRIDLLTDALYDLDAVPKYDGHSTVARWVALTEFQNGRKILYPTGLLELITTP